MDISASESIVGHFVEIGTSFRSSATIAASLVDTTDTIVYDLCCVPECRNNADPVFVLTGNFFI